MKNRNSTRVYSGKKVDNNELAVIAQCADFAPSSCNRHAIEIVESKEGTEELVGGTNWANKADKILLIYANMKAYKSPNEVDFMPYLDAGFYCQNIYLICEALNIGCCFINPNRTGKKLDREGYTFCGAIALGK